MCGDGAVRPCDNNLLKIRTAGYLAADRADIAFRRAGMGDKNAAQIEILPEVGA